LIALPHEPRDAAVDGAALRGGLPGHALPRALGLDADTDVAGGGSGRTVAVGRGGGAVLARLRHCVCGERRREERWVANYGGLAGWLF
jgi:hypothetical protein